MIRFKLVFMVLMAAPVAVLSAQTAPVLEPHAVPSRAPQRPAMPPLPVYHGQAAVGGPVVFLSLPDSPEKKRYRAGDKVGPFKLVSFDSQTITLDWSGKKIQRKLADLASKEKAPAEAKPASTSTSSSDTNPTLGFETGPGFRACTATDNSPNGTIVDGYKKVVGQGLMGKSCYWEKVK